MGRYSLLCVKQHTLWTSAEAVNDIHTKSGEIWSPQHPTILTLSTLPVTLNNIKGICCNCFPNGSTFCIENVKYEAAERNWEKQRYIWQWRKQNSFYSFYYSCLGAVLIFLPGLAEIQALYTRLQSNAMFNNRHNKRYCLFNLLLKEKKLKLIF